MADPIPTRFLHPIGTRAYLRIYWGEGCKLGYHAAKVLLTESGNPQDWQLGGAPSDHPEACWPTTCDACGAIAPPQTVLKKGCSDPTCDCTRPEVTRHIHHRILYQVAGSAVTKVRDELEPGDMFYATWYDCDKRGGKCIHGWTNCDGKHLTVILPDGTKHPWDVDGRASNCDKLDDTTHRCWVRNGDPATGKVHVTKGPAGHISQTTCNAGAGSIWVRNPDWHGFLHNGLLVKC